MPHRWTLTILVIASFLSSIAIGSTSIVAPWLLLESFSPIYYTVLASLVAVSSIFFLPVLGSALRSRRARNFLSASSLLMSVLLFVAYALSGSSLGIKPVIAVVFVAMELFYLVFLSSRVTLVKRTVPEELYSRTSTLLELELQIAAFGAGAIAAFLLRVFDPSVVLVCNAFLFVLSAGLFMLIVEPIPSSQASTDPRLVPNAVPTEGEPSFPIVTFVLALNVPFVCVMLFNVIAPIHISGVLSGAAQDLAVANLFYAAGSIMSPFLIWFVLRRERSFLPKIFVLFLAFSAAALTVQFLGRLQVLFWCCLAFGIINSTAKVAGQTALLKYTATETVSVVTAKAQVKIQVLRVISMMVLSLIVLVIGTKHLFVYMALVALLGPLLLITATGGNGRWTQNDVAYRSGRGSHVPRPSKDIR